VSDSDQVVPTVSVSEWLTVSLLDRVLLCICATERLKLVLRDWVCACDWASDCE
jgi:hypothetical protein